jgi:APA family basic amino acid/polyamine antiporter
MEQGGLKRVLGFKEALTINLGAMLGGGMFVIIGIAAFDSGPALIVAILISAAVAMLTGLSFSQIATRVQKEGGTYEYAKETLNPFSGFVAGWMWTFGCIIAVAAVALSLGGYVNALFDTSFSPVYLAVVAIVSFTLLNIFGVKNSAKTISYIVIINVSILAIFTVAGLTNFHSGNFSGFFDKGSTGILSGAALIFFAFTGFSSVTTVSGEVKDPEKTIPKAIVYSILISSLLYVVIAIVLIGLIPTSTLSSSTSPLSLGIASLHDPYLDIIIAIGGITATAGVTLTGILGTSRVLFAMSRDNELPKKISTIDKFSTPEYAIIISAVLSIFFIAFVSFTTIIEAANASVLIAYLIINFAAFYQRFIKDKVKEKNVKHRKILGKYFVFIPFLGIGTIFVILYFLGIYSLEVSGLILLVGVGYFGIKQIAEKIGKKEKSDEHVPVFSTVRLFGKTREKAP